MIRSTCTTSPTRTNRSNKKQRTEMKKNDSKSPPTMDTCCMCQQTVSVQQIRQLSCSVKDIDYLSICIHCMVSDSDHSRDDFSMSCSCNAIPP